MCAKYFSNGHVTHSQQLKPATIFKPHQITTLDSTSHNINQYHHCCINYLVWFDIFTDNPHRTAIIATTSLPSTLPQSFTDATDEAFAVRIQKQLHQTNQKKSARYFPLKILGCPGWPRACTIKSATDIIKTKAKRSFIAKPVGVASSSLVWLGCQIDEVNVTKEIEDDGGCWTKGYCTKFNQR